jgi:succinate dehydrogenase / fumarate reductase, cytochrome b subunit
VIGEVAQVCTQQLLPSDTRVDIVKDKRPVNLDIGSIQLPLAALASITHRVSGVIVFVGIALLLWLLDTSLASEQGFNALFGPGMSMLAKLLVWGVLSALAYHMVAGVKHLLMDFGIGESREAGPRGAKIVIVVSVVLIALLGVWVW